MRENGRQCTTHNDKRSSTSKQGTPSHALHIAWHDHVDAASGVSSAHCQTHALRCWRVLVGDRKGLPDLKFLLMNVIHFDCTFFVTASAFAALCPSAHWMMSTSTRTTTTRVRAADEQQRECIPLSLSPQTNESIAAKIFISTFISSQLQAL